MKKLFLILSLLLLNSCGSLFSASLAETLFNPSSIASSLVNYGIKKHTGKTISEHALSKMTDKDCEISIENLNKPHSFCKNKETVENSNVTKKIEALSQTRNNKTSLALITPKLKTISAEKPSTSNEVYLLSLNEVLHKDFNSFGIRRSN